MKHGVAFRKFSRTSSHRMLMLRNLVTSLFEHEHIKTTLPKARDTARLAEKIITLGKKGTQNAHKDASAFLLKPVALNNLVEKFASRYSERPGGYTRIHKFGTRQGDNAPHAIIELVDGPHDIKREVTIRAIARDLLKNKLQASSATAVSTSGLQKVDIILKSENELSVDAPQGFLRLKTRLNLQKLLKFKGPEEIQEISKAVVAYADELIANPLTYQTLHDEKKAKDFSALPPRRLAGQKLLGEERPALSIAKGALAHDVKPPTPRKRFPAFSMENALTRGFARHYGSHRARITEGTPPMRLGV